MRLAFDSLVAVVQEQYSALALTNPQFAQALRVYRSAGGSARKWKVAGIYATARNDARCVLEVFVHAEDDLCVVRVYQDDPLTFHYAFKTTTGLESATCLVREAAEIFRGLVPSDAKNASETDIPEELGPNMIDALAPIPPPITLEHLAEVARPNKSLERTRER
jgi:hypothetical protein